MATSIQHDFALLTIQDGEPLTEILIDKVANRLGSDWKRLGLQLQLKEYELDLIDCDWSRHYDKSFEMIKRWKQMSPVEVTQGILKLQLQKMNRNDIVYDVFQGGRKSNIPHNVEGIGIEKSPSSFGVSEVTEFEPTIEDLNIKNKYEFCGMLDIDHGSCIRNWRDVGSEFAGDNKQLSDQIKNLNLHYAGGGNPALTFFESLSQRRPNLTFEKFKEIAKDLNRNDIVQYKKKLNAAQKFCDLSLQDKETLAGMLNKRVPGVYDWEFFAEELDYTHSEILNIKTSIKSENSYSPTEKLLELMKQIKPGFKLQELAELCSRLQRNDVAQFLRRVIEELKIKKSR